MLKTDLEAYGFEYKKHLDLYVRIVILDRHPYDPSIFKIDMVKIYGKDAEQLTQEQLDSIWGYAADRDFKHWNGYCFTNRND